MAPCCLPRTYCDHPRLERQRLSPVSAAVASTRTMCGSDVPECRPLVVCDGGEPSSNGAPLREPADACFELELICFLYVFSLVHGV